MHPNPNKAATVLRVAEHTPAVALWACKVNNKTNNQPLLRLKFIFFPEILKYYFLLYSHDKKCQKRYYKELMVLLVREISI